MRRGAAVGDGGAPRGTARSHGLSPGPRSALLQRQAAAARLHAVHSLPEQGPGPPAEEAPADPGKRPPVPAVADAAAGSVPQPVSAAVRTLSFPFRLRIS